MAHPYKKKLRVLLINPGKTVYKGTAHISKFADFGMPIGLMYVAAVLEKEGHEVKITDCLGSSLSKVWKEGERHQMSIPKADLISQISEFNPEIVGISSQFSSQENNTLSVAKIVRETLPDALLVVGGPHVSAVGQEFLRRHNDFDIVVKGEGERTITDIAQYVLGKKNLSSIKGIIYRSKKGEIFESQERGFLRDLDDLPYPSYHLIDMERYLTMSSRGIYSRNKDVKRDMPMITSRGCPHMCIFCSVHITMGRCWRPHSVEYVIKHMRFLKEKYDIGHLYIEDDNFNCSIDRCNQILDRMIQDKLNIEWSTPNGVRADRLSKEILIKMKQSGCTSISIGVESGDQEILDTVVCKRLDLRDVVKVAKWCQEIDLPLRPFFIIGLPGEKKENMERTVRFALMLARKYGVEVHGGAMVATPIYGSRLYEICKEKNYLAKPLTPRNLEEAKQIEGEGLIRTEDFDPLFLKKINLRFTRWGYFYTGLKYIKNPIKLARRIGNFASLKRITKQVLNIK